jgi:phosphatidylethanolamine/phosphatidyl-N-methylethanolamine N-methyltransferase
MRPNTLSFLKALFSNPRSIGAIIPSSRYLAQSISQCISITPNGFILELGPGTGAITQGILQSGILEDQLIALELSPELINALKINYPHINIVHGNATELSTLLQNIKFDTIISSLPLLSLPKTDLNRILEEIPKVLQPGGKLIQFTYDIFNRKNIFPSHFKLEKSIMEWRNLPPARINIYVINKP